MSEDKETTRLEAFSDGVFAIAMTLLVLDLKIPEHSAEPLGPLLLSRWPSFVAYLNSFVTILVIWMNHHNLFTNIRRTNNFFMIANGLLLLTVTFLPFPTALAAEYYGHPGATTAAALYAGTFVVMAVMFNILWRYASHRHRLIVAHVPAEEIAAVNRQYLVGPTVYGLAFVLAFIDVTASLAVTVALAIFYAITGSLSRERRKG